MERMFLIIQQATAGDFHVDSFEIVSRWSSQIKKMLFDFWFIFVVFLWRWLRHSIRMILC